MLDYKPRKQQPRKQHHNHNNDCPIWLAPSQLSTDTKPKWGLYAGTAMPANHSLPYKDLAIPMVDWQAASPHTLADFVESSVLWTSEYADGLMWEAADPTPLALPGLPALMYW